MCVREREGERERDGQTKTTHKEASNLQRAKKTNGFAWRLSNHPNACSILKRKNQTLAIKKLTSFV